MPSLPLWASWTARLEIGDAAPLGAGLEDPAEVVHGVGQGLAIGDGQAAGLLAVDVLAGLGREDRRRACQRSPVAIRTASMSCRASSSRKSR